MADELAPIEGDLEGVVTPPECDGAEIASPRTIEDYARERGWKPKEEWTGAGEWKDAQAFIDYGLDRARELGDHVKQLNRKIDGVHRSTEELTRREAEKARAEERQRWEQMLSVAVEEGNKSAAIEATQKIAELSVQPVQQDRDPLVAQFIADNAWFNTDPTAQAVAVAEAGRIGAAGGDTAAQLKAAREAVLKRFPEYAPAATAAPAKVVDVAAPAARTAARTTGKKGFADLTAEQQLAAKYLVQTGRIKSVDAYVAQAFNKEGTIE